MASEITQLLNPPAPISAIAFSPDRNQVAISPNSSEIHIYEKKGGEWGSSPAHILAEHDKLVTGLDWAASGNRLVSCSQDRNAYVWTLADGKWQPTLVLLRINRAATVVKWSPKEDKFAVGSGDRCISVCYFDKDHDWWVAKHIKKPIRSTVLSLDWHPNNTLLAAGSAEFCARVFAAGIKGVDAKPEPTAWGESNTFGDCLAEFKVNSAVGWVHAVGFSPDGAQLAFAGHGASVHVVAAANKANVNTINTLGLPFRALLWLTPKSFVAAGHDNNPTLFTGDGFRTIRELDAGKVEEAKSSTARSVFANMDKKGSTDDETKLKTLHQNAISALTIVKGTRAAVSQFATAGVDGQVIVWDTKSLESALAGLKIN